MSTITIRKAPQGNLQHELAIRGHRLIVDEDASLGGDDAGPNPHDLLDSSLAACTALTLTLYAKRKGFDLKDVRVSITHEESPGYYKLNRKIELVGDLNEEQRARLLEIANKCPLHRILSGKIEVQTALEGAPAPA
jgi:putative redox protein